MRRQRLLACAVKEGLHFHEQHRTAQKNRRNWLKTNHPNLVEIWDQLWGMYGALGYGGLNGERAKQATLILKKVLTELSKREKIAISSL